MRICNKQAHCCGDLRAPGSPSSSTFWVPAPQHHGHPRGFRVHIDCQKLWARLQQSPPSIPSSVAASGAGRASPPEGTAVPKTGSLWEAD